MSEALSDELSQLALPALGEPDYESGLPADGLEYLRRVRHEASRLPHVTRSTAVSQPQFDCRRTAYLRLPEDFAAAPAGSEVRSGISEAPRLELTRPAQPKAAWLEALAPQFAALRAVRRCCGLQQRALTDSASAHAGLAPRSGGRRRGAPPGAAARAAAAARLGWMAPFLPGQSRRRRRGGPVRRVQEAPACHAACAGLGSLAHRRGVCGTPARAELVNLVRRGKWFPVSAFSPCSDSPLPRRR